VLHPGRARDCRAGAHGRVGVRQAHASWDGGRVRTRRIARWEVRRLVLLRDRDRGDGVLHERDRMGVVLRPWRDCTRDSRSARRVGSAPARHWLLVEVVAVADGLYGGRDAVVLVRAPARTTKRYRTREPDRDSALVRDSWRPDRAR